ncbi:DUF4168 domain-containing protein [Salipiger mucosus]|uniref:DUF4168 domain-containing protein n=1 Tax=Salipiger mucosus DSM 16094 TaxID=1123237 RepID=S9R0L7_9RHOB|nr:DUF4168 domain-containing protein [Salipiger mucosus]EPX85427.1 hypothetical protein Salmuc_02808 [Salipiger mucosus DSM 16094]
MKLNGTLLKSTVIAALVAAPVAPVLAQSAETEAPAETQEAPAMSYSEAELESFVDAAMEVMELRASYMPRIQATESQEEQQSLMEEAQSEMMAAIEATEGMTVETYNEIGQAAQQNAELNERLVAMAQERQQAQNTENDG